jgi:UDP-N-acetylmuramoylalanine--D-glutamate ligase
MTYNNKKALVCGLGLSGIAAARLLLSQGALVTICDLNPDPVLEEKHPKLSTYFGKNPDDIIKDYDLVVLSPGIATDLPFVALAKSLNIPVLSEIELAARHCKAPIMAVTGTNGKTTTCSLLGDIMKLAFSGSALVGNIGIAFSGLAQTIKQDSWVVAEISSFQLETIIDFKPKISAVLNITPDHLNRHKTMEAYIAAKERIFENQGPEDYCILNYDDENTKAMADKTKAQVIFFSHNLMPNGVFIQNNAIQINLHGINQEVIKLESIPIPGIHNLENVMAAVAMCFAAGVPLDIIASGIKDFKAVEHRLEFVLEKDGVVYYNDSKATNVDSAVKGIEAIAALNKPIVLIGGGQDKGLDYDRLIKLFPGRVKDLIVIGEAANILIHTCRTHNFQNFEQANTMRDAVMLAAAKAKPGDAVLLSPACASYDMFDNYEQRGEVFKNFVRELT